MSEDEFPEEDGLTLIGTKFTVNASEKVSTGKYENYDPQLTVEGKIPMAQLDAATREELKGELLALHGDLQAVLNRAAGNRIAEPEHEDWTFGDEGPAVRTVEEMEAEADGGNDE